MRLWKRRDAVRDLVYKHLACVREALETFEKATRAYCVDEDPGKADEFALATHRAEGKADDIRRSVEKAMLSGVLLPSSRKQILEIVEHTDTLANAAEASLDTLLLQRVRIPKTLVPLISQTVELTLGAFEELESAIRNLLAGKGPETLEYVARVEQIEGEIDIIERSVQKQLFAMDIGLAEKLQVAGYIADLVKVSDRAEDVSDQVALIAAERAF